MNLISSSFLRLRMRSESSSSLNSASSGPGPSILSSPSSPTSTAATSALTSALEDDDFDIIQDLYIRKDAGMEPSTRQAYESVLLPLINQELVHSTYAERYSITLCSIRFQKSAFSPAILISTPTPRAKKRIFAHLSSLTDLKVALKEHNLALHVVVHHIRRCGGPNAQLGDVGKLAYVVLRPGSNALCGSKIVIPKSGRMELSSCTSGLTFTVGGRECGKTALHPWEDSADAVTDTDSESSLSDEEDDETDDGLALSLLTDGTGLLEESDNSSSLFSDCSIDGLEPLPQTRQLASYVTNAPPNENESAQSARRGPSRVNPIYQGLQTDWLLYDAQEAAPDIALSELTRNEVDGYKITKFHREDPDAKISVTIADHEAVVYGYIQPGAVSFRSGSRVYDLRLVTLEYPLRPGCSGAAVTHQDEIFGTIQVISEDIPWAYMVPIEAELKEMEAVCGLPVRLSGAEEADVVELDSKQSFASTPTERSATDSSSDRTSCNIFVVPLDHQINPATEAAILMHGNGMHTTDYEDAPANTAEAAEALTYIERTYRMVEPIGLTSGLLALATFAFQSSITLCKTVQSFQSHPKRVRDLIEELEALSGVLGQLAETVSSTTDVELFALDLPLLRCGKSCKEFEQKLMKCSSSSGGSRTSFRDWAKLRYIGEDIDGFRRLLAGYKLTINIALTDANLHKFSVTAESIESAESYKELIKTATSGLESHLESINEKLEIIFKQTVTESDSDAAEQRLIKEEQLSTQRCLQICAQLSDHISQIQLTPKRSSSSPGQIDPDAFPEIVTNAGLQESMNGLILTTAKLERHMQDLMDRLVTKSKRVMASEEAIADLTRLRDEWETARQCIDICSKADKHLQESIGTINVTGDAVQFMVSTDGKTVYSKNREPRWRTRQVGGLLSDVSLQQLSRDMASVSIWNTGNKGPPSRGDTQSVLNDELENGPISDFQERYGRGFQLQDLTTSSSTSVERRQNSSPQC